MFHFGQISPPSSHVVMKPASARRDPLLPIGPEPFFAKMFLLGVEGADGRWFSLVFSIFFLVVSSGVHALAWFEAINTTSAVHHVFLPDWPEVGISYCRLACQQPSATHDHVHADRRASIVFLCSWFACLLLFMRTSASGISLASDWWSWCARS